jgi:hypothetical protein
MFTPQHSAMQELFILSLVSLFVSMVFCVQSAFRHNWADDFTIGDTWEVLGPFQSGTREQQWGADPLHTYGGFTNIEYNTTQRFTSSLNGTVHFGYLTASSPIVQKNALSRKIPVEFPNVNWGDLEQSFGWAALQFQAWIRGTLKIPIEGRYGLWIGRAVEFYLDGTYYDIGNLYDDSIEFTRGGLFLDLTTGEHILEIRVVNDIRAFGGQIPPKVEVSVTVRKAESDLVVADYDSHGGWVLPSLINMARKDGRKRQSCVAGDWASLALRNEGREWITITELSVDKVQSYLI